MVDFLFADASGTNLFRFRTDAQKLTTMDRFTILDISFVDTTNEKALVDWAYKRGLSYTLDGIKSFASTNSLNLVAYELGGSYGSQGVQQTVLATVGTVTPSVISTTQIDLAWTAVTNANGYIVERATNTGFTTGVQAGVLTGTNSFKSTGLTTGTAYYYRVTAVGAFGFAQSAAASAVATATTS